MTSVCRHRTRYLAIPFFNTLVDVLNLIIMTLYLVKMTFFLVILSVAKYP